MDAILIASKSKRTDWVKNAIPNRTNQFGRRDSSQQNERSGGSLAILRFGVDEPEGV
jgi:hypothetical protein